MAVPDLSNAVALPPERAFVIQLHAAPDDGAEIFAGRAEHVASGEAARFGSIPELIAFVRQVLASDATPTVRTPVLPGSTRHARTIAAAPRSTT